MNKKGQALIFGIMLMILALVVVSIVIHPLVEVIDLTRSADSLNCTSTTISTGRRATCLVVDIYLPYFVITALFLGGGYLVQKKVRETF